MALPKAGLKATVGRVQSREPSPAPSVLLVGDDSARTDSLARIVCEAGARPEVACEFKSAERLLRECEADAILIDLGRNCEGLDLLRRIAPQHPACILVDDGGERMRDAMRAGAVDVLTTGASGDDVARAIAAAMSRARVTRQRESSHARREERLRRVCESLSKSRRELIKEINGLCETFAQACDSLTSQVEHGSMASEFNTLIRQELDVESLLRTVLEFTLPRIGPTNAAIFLPSTSGDYSLGAYVNYDRPRETGEMLMDHLAGTVPAAMEETDTIVMTREAADFERRLALDTDTISCWLDGSSVTAFSCSHDGECLAVVVFWRDQGTGFDVSLLPTLTVIRDLFSKQLARVVRTHHRHRPKNQWGAEEDGGFGDIDLAA